MYQLKNTDEITADLDYHAREFSGLAQRKKAVEQEILALVSEGKAIPDELREKLAEAKSEMQYHRTCFQSSKNRLFSEVTYQVNSFDLPSE
jgi:hypothetical protein